MTSSEKKSALGYDAYTVALVCPLEIERRAARFMLDEEHAPLHPIPGDANTYLLGSISGHNAVISSLPYGYQGIASAAVVAHDMERSFPSIKLRLLVGIGGGVPGNNIDIRLGDVVVSAPSVTHGGVIQYDLGKQTVTGFQRKGFLCPPPLEWLTMLPHIQVEHRAHGNKISKLISEMQDRYPYLVEFQRPPNESDLLFVSDYAHIPDQPTCVECDRTMLVDRCARQKPSEPMIHYGLIASGNRVIKDALERDKLSRSLDGAVCFEMEAAGLMNTSPCLVIRGISDYADSHKNDTWHPYAAASAAAFAKELLSYIKLEPNNISLQTLLGTIPRSDERIKPCFVMPLDRNDHFVGRDSTIFELETRLFEEARHCRVAAVGLGGIGKTQIAIELAYRARERSPDCSIFWVPATSLESFEQAYSEVGRQLQITEFGDEKSNIKDVVKSWLSHHTCGQWLMIVDNADDVDLFFGERRLVDYLPSSQSGSILITTRNRRVATRIAQTNVIEISVMGEDMSILLFKKLTTQLDTSDDSLILALLRRLTFLPLAIAQAAAYMNENSTLIQDYLSLLEASEATAADILSEHFDDDRRYRESRNAVITTWFITFEEMQSNMPLAATYLSFMSCLNPKNIPHSLLPPGTSQKMVIEAIGTLLAYSFIHRSHDNQSYDLHSLVHLATRSWLSRQGLLLQFHDLTLARLADLFPSNDYHNRPLWIVYLPHAEYALSHIPAGENQQPRYALLEKVGLCLFADWRYNEAVNVQREVLKWKGEMFGLKHPATLKTFDRLGEALRKSGLLAESFSMHTQAVEGNIAIYGHYNASTLTSLSQLVATQWSLGNRKEAIKMNAQVLEARQQVLGLDHPDTLESLSDLASIYQSQRKLKEAEELNLRLLMKAEQILGPCHPFTIKGLNDLAAIYQSDGCWGKAEEVTMEALTRQRAVLQPDHPSMLKTMSGLVETYINQGRLQEAEALNFQVIEGRNKVLGIDHQMTLGSLKRLADIYLKQGKYIEAQTLHMHVLKRRYNDLGPNHPRTLRALSSLINTYEAQDMDEKVENLGSYFRSK